jgi:hydroxymethylpyrimidine pyrophosphatase-like HAD family hydrolase
MITQFRAVFLDIDGTLVGETGVLSSRTSESLQRAQEQGCALILCTGRNRYAAARVAKQIGGQGYGIVMNGALVCDWQSGRILRQALIPLPFAREAIRLTHRAGLAPIWLGIEEREKALYTDRRRPLWPRYEERNRDRLNYWDDLSVRMPSEPASLVAYGVEPDMIALKEMWEQGLGANVLAFAAPTPPFGCWYAQLTSAEADKSLAAKAVAGMLGISQEQTLAIGDQVNDLELLRWAGIGVCMGDGHPEARASADYITGTLADDGVAQAIERFILIG